MQGKEGGAVAFDPGNTLTQQFGQTFDQFTLLLLREGTPKVPITRRAEV